MINKIYGQIFKRSPWDNFDNNKEENIFTKKRKEHFNFNEFQFKFDKKTFLLGVGALLLLWLASGIYKVQEGEQAVITRFGSFNRLGMPGLNYHLPYPLEEAFLEKVNRSRRIEIGYRSSGTTERNRTSVLRDVSSESIMLTGDENIVDLHADVMWHISSLPKYIFNVASPEDTVKAVSEGAIREVIGNTPISAVLSNQKQEITTRIENLIQQTLDLYEIGVNIEQVQLLKAEPPKEVIQAYRDVQTAKADKEKLINQAQSYNNNVLPKARGEAAKIRESAEGYKAEVVAKAKGDTSRFNAIYKQYIESKEVTKNRMYLETVEEILQKSDKVIMGSQNMLPHMAIQQKKLLRKE